MIYVILIATKIYIYEEASVFIITWIFGDEIISNKLFLPGTILDLYALKDTKFRANNLM